MNLFIKLMKSITDIGLQNMMQNTVHWKYILISTNERQIMFILYQAKQIIFYYQKIYCLLLQKKMYVTESTFYAFFCMPSFLYKVAHKSEIKIKFYEEFSLRIRTSIQKKFRFYRGDAVLTLPLVRGVPFQLPVLTVPLFHYSAFKDFWRFAKLENVFCRNFKSLMCHECFFVVLEISFSS